MNGAAITPVSAFLTEARERLHTSLIADRVLAMDGEQNLSFADNTSKTSRAVATGIFALLLGQVGADRLKGQTAGVSFEAAVEAFLNDTFDGLSSALPPGFRAERMVDISSFAQYRHLEILERLAQDKTIRNALGGDYVVRPDVVVSRSRLSDDDLNRATRLVDERFGMRATLRNPSHDVLHASVSCKLTIRSDRSQNSRLEALNLLRMRRGRAPHIVVVTAEPLPSRIASVAMGTGDFDCVYAIALPELRRALEASLAEAAKDRWKKGGAKPAEVSRIRQLDILEQLEDSGRLKDIADLPLDLML
jgi:hypothetical protein